MAEKPKVSIICTAYNHEKFIAQALDGFLMQKTDFPFEILINDDASPDNTANIIREYQAKYPDKIRAFYQEKNLWSSGKEAALDFLYPEIQSEYVAICEGDDYWTDENKLQKQVDFLDKHKDYSICFHAVKVFYEDGSQPDLIYPTDEMLKGRTTLEFLDELQFNYIQTNSVLYRWIFDRNENKIEDILPRYMIPTDWFLHLLHAHKGKIGYIPEIMGVYRKHSGGCFYDYKTAPENFYLKHGISHTNFFLQLEKTFPEYLKYGGHKHTMNIAFNAFSVYSKHQRFEDMQCILTMCPDFLNYVSGV